MSVERGSEPWQCPRLHLLAAAPNALAGVALGVAETASGHVSQSKQWTVDMNNYASFPISGCLGPVYQVTGRGPHS